MHRPRSISAARCLRIAGLLLLGSRLLAMIAVGLLLVSLLANNRHLMIVGSGFLIISFVLIVAQWISASRAASASFS